MYLCLSVCLCAKGKSRLYVLLLTHGVCLYAPVYVCVLGCVERRLQPWRGLRAQLLRQHDHRSDVLRSLRADGAVCARQRRRRRPHETPRGQSVSLRATRSLARHFYRTTLRHSAAPAAAGAGFTNVEAVVGLMTSQ